MTLLRHLPRLIAAVRGYPRARLGLAAHAAGGSSAFGFSEQVSNDFLSDVVVRTQWRRRSR